MHYRSEIDGLRALAVLPVILYHSDIGGFSGGYVGVDIFFVISGYLITTILKEDLEAGRFSIWHFYERRARRILPALFLVMLVCMPFAWLWMLPSQLKDFSQSVAAVSLFVSNILFLQETNYFDGAADLKPLLHTWSLAVEEQYYIVFPVLLLLIWRLNSRSVRSYLALFALLSLALCEYASRNYPAANFYLVPTRAWELLAGSLCAFSTLKVASPARSFLGFAGLAMIVVSIFLFDESTRFPSLYALVPVVGTVFLILFGTRGTPVARILSMQILVGIGLISYSAYLWHQPLFAFARLRSLTEPGLPVMLFLTLLTLLLAYISWRFVELPFRRRGNPLIPSRNVLLVSAAVGSIVFSTLGVFGHLTAGFPERQAGGIALGILEHRTRANVGLHADCKDLLRQKSKCQTTNDPSLLLWGDSFAMHLAEALTASDDTGSFVQYTKSSCAPVLGVSHFGARHSRKWAQECISFNDAVLEWLQSNDTVDLVVLSSPFGGLIHNPILSRDGNEFPKQSDPSLLAKRIKRTVEQIHELGRRVVIVSATPRSGWDIGQCAVRSVIFGHPESICNFPLNHDSLYRQLISQVTGDVPVIWLSDMICPNSHCHPIQEGVFLYNDYGHLSYEGAEYLGRRHMLATQIYERAN